MYHIYLMGSSQSISRKVNFEDIQFLFKKNDNYLLINTLHKNEQDILIKNTIEIDKEENIINNFLNKNINVNIIIYDKNANAPNLMKKYEQLLSLGFVNVYIYPGGLFEWLCLQDIYGFDNFPTTKKELDILKYKAKSLFLNNYLKNDDI